MDSRSQATLSLARELVDDIELTRLGPRTYSAQGLASSTFVGRSPTIEWPAV